jgi:DNA-binding IclR family transcriptional regulator
MTSSSSLNPSHINKSSVNVLRVLSVFAQHNAEFGVSDISKKLDITKNMAFRALKTLVEEGFLVRDASGSRYILGFPLELLNPDFDDPDIQTLCREFMQRMHAVSELTVALQIPVGYSHITIDGIESRRGQVLARVVRGISVPLHISPGSRAILAFLKDREIDTYIKQHQPLEAYTKNSITNPKKLWEDVERVRRNGYALGYQDHFLGVNGIAFPVLDIEQRPHGAITVVGPQEVISQDELLELVPQLKNIVDELNSITRFYHASPIFSHL